MRINKVSSIAYVGWDGLPHNYLRKVLDLVQGVRREPGTIQDVHILHDDWCGVFVGGACNCDPDVRIAS